MKKPKNKKGKVDLFIIVVSLFFLLILGLLIIGGSNYLLNYQTEKECFEDIAKEYCQEQGDKFYKLNYQIEFECIKGRRVMGIFKFTEQEKEDCFVWDWLR